jgi:hypothetical protein
MTLKGGAVRADPRKWWSTHIVMVPWHSPPQ